MNDVEREGLVNYIANMTNEEKMIVLEAMPFQMLINAANNRALDTYCKLNSIMDHINEIAKNQL